MSKGKELIAQGIENDDMDLVSMGLELVKKEKEGSPVVSTIEVVDNTKVVAKTKVRQMEGVTSIKRNSSATRTKVDDDGKEYTIMQKEPINKRKMGINLFDAEFNKKDGREHADVDKKLYTRDPVARREEVQPVKINCRSCSKSFSISSALLRKDSETREIFYVCDSCIKNRRG